MDPVNFECPACGQKLRFAFKEEHAGKTVEVRCPTCGTHIKKDVGPPLAPPEPPQDLPDEEIFEKHSDVSEDVERAMKDIKERIQSDPVIRERLKQIRGSGYTFAFALMLYDKGETGQAAPKVDKEGNIEEGVFSDEDKRKFRETFRINLDE